MKQFKHLATIGFLILPFISQAKPLPPASIKPKLILQITIDQFSGNQLDRFKRHIQQGAFHYLTQHSLWYDNAHHPHATTETAVGHSALATGTVPAIHGIIANWWWDKNTKHEIYAFNDPKHPVLDDDSTERNYYGRSPKNLLAPSFADSLALATQAKSKRFAVSTKDRGAIPLAGHMGKAFWLDTRTGKYVTTDYYYKAPPKWLKLWNKQQLPNKYVGTSWQLLKPCRNYIFCNNHLKPFQSTLKSYGKAFPHALGNKVNDTYYKHFYISPFSDQVLLQFAKQLVLSEKIGISKQTDYLSISLSATDAIGHTFGPNSLESEDNFIRLNHNLGQFLKFIDKEIGLDKTLIILSADHGVSPSPSYLKQLNFPAFELSEVEIMNYPAVKSYLEQHQLDWQQLVIGEIPDLYLNDEYLAQKNIDKQQVISELITRLNQVPGISQAVSTQAILTNSWQHPLLKKALNNQINLQRSGDIYLIPQPYCNISSNPYSKVNHGTPWAYDSHVPIIFAHSSFKAQRIHRKVYTTAIAPTLAALSNSPPLATSIDQPLKEFR